MKNSSLVATHTFLVAIIDDDASVRRAVHRLIRSLGHSVVSYASVNEFMRSPDFKEAACLILDIQMPGLSGIDLQDILYAMHAPIPIIFVTGDQNEDVRTRALALGSVGLLEKPFEDKALIDLIQKVQNKILTDVRV